MGGGSSGYFGARLAFTPSPQMWLAPLVSYLDPPGPALFLDAEAGARALKTLARTGCPTTGGFEPPRPPNCPSLGPAASPTAASSAGCHLLSGSLPSRESNPISPYLARTAFALGSAYAVVPSSGRFARFHPALATGFNVGSNVGVTGRGLRPRRGFPSPHPAFRKSGPPACLLAWLPFVGTTAPASDAYGLLGLGLRLEPVVGSRYACPDTPTPSATLEGRRVYRRPSIAPRFLSRLGQPSRVAERLFTC